MTIPLKTRFDILERDHFTCRFCGRRAPETELEVDHLLARSRDGSDDETNLVTACRDCNRGKGDRQIALPDDVWGSLIGKFFHSLSGDGYAEWQGHIVGWIPQGYWVVELFSWLLGDLAVGRRVITPAEMQGWRFYPSVEEMRYAAKHGEVRTRGPVEDSFLIEKEGTPMDRRNGISQAV
jgi:hypothetical protein